MEIEELRSKIFKAYDVKWFENVTETLPFSLQNNKIVIKGVSSIHEFINTQVVNWEKVTIELPEGFNNSLINLKQLKIQIEYFVENHREESSNLLTNNWEAEVRPHLQNLIHCFVFEHPITQFLLSIWTNKRDYFLGAFEFIKGNSSQIANKKDNFIGSLMAYEFTKDQNSSIIAKNEAETKSLEQLKENFYSYISESEKHLIDYLKKTDIKVLQFAQSLEDFELEKKEQIDTWFESTKEKIETFDNSSQENILNLEKTYEEKLRLSKPADYWNKRALKLKDEGWLALWWLVGLIVFACLTLYCLLWLTPEGMLLSFISGNASALKWSIIYVTFVSFLAVGIRAVSKVMFSAFHLSRDAEEREQLTYLYLALNKDATIDKEDKNLIIQSLFSRADTGLLREDSSPTMPGGIADKFINRHG